MNTTPRRFSATLLCLVAGTLALAACDNDNQTAGQRADETVAKVERQGDAAAADTRTAGGDVSQAVEKTVDSVSNTSKDLAITAEVKTRLARDSELSALAINVDTAEGRVVLRGTAPDLAAHDRATVLAQAVDGVVAVNNELAVQSR